MSPQESWGSRYSLATGPIYKKLSDFDFYKKLVLYEIFYVKKLETNFLSFFLIFALIEIYAWTVERKQNQNTAQKKRKKINPFL